MEKQGSRMSLLVEQAGGGTSCREGRNGRFLLQEPLTARAPFQQSFFALTDFTVVCHVPLGNTSSPRHVRRLRFHLCLCSIAFVTLPAADFNGADWLCRWHWLTLNWSFALGT